VLKNQAGTLPQAQKVRRTLAKSLLSDGWTQEGLAFIEKIKDGLGQNEEDAFFYEMQVLNFDKVLKQADRNRRFLEVIRNTLKRPEEAKAINIAGEVVGPRLIWARGNFELKTLQVNKYNKLQVEVFSKVPEDINIAKIQLVFNDSQLNQEVVGPMKLSKATPIVVDRELYVSKENYSIHREYIQLVEVILEIAKENADQNGLQFVLKPY
jgi:hypothetical protein